MDRSTPNRRNRRAGRTEGTVRITYCERLQSATAALIRSALPPGLEMRCVDGPDDDIHAAVADADALLVARTPVDAALLDAAPHVRLVQHQGVGFDNVDIEALHDRGVRLALTPIGSESVAEHTVMLMLSTLRHLVEADRTTKAGAWRHYDLRMRGSTLSERRIGLVGAGRIARAVARRLRGWEAEVAYWSRSRLSPEDEAELGLTYRDWDELLTCSDILSLHIPLTEETQGIVGGPQLGQLPAGAILINTARGELVDEEALHKALRDGLMGGAGLDVFDREPVSASNLLLARRDVVATPHTAGATPSVIVAKMRHAFANVERLRDGLPLRDEVPIG